DLDRAPSWAPPGLAPPAPVVRCERGSGVLACQVVCVARAGSWGPATAEAGGQAAASGRATLGAAPPVGGDTGGTAASGSRPSGWGALNVAGTAPGAGSAGWRTPADRAVGGCALWASGVPATFTTARPVRASPRARIGATRRATSRRVIGRPPRQRGRRRRGRLRRRGA